MIRKEMQDKYQEAVKAVATANDCDMDVAYDKIRYMAQNPDGEKYPGVPEGFDFGAFLEDLNR